jgi:hypothetical protein
MCSAARRRLRLTTRPTVFTACASWAWLAICCVERNWVPHAAKVQASRVKPRVNPTMSSTSEKPAWPCLMWSSIGGLRWGCCGARRGSLSRGRCGQHGIGCAALGRVYPKPAGARQPPTPQTPYWWAGVLATRSVLAPRPPSFPAHVALRSGNAQHATGPVLAPTASVPRAHPCAATAALCCGMRGKPVRPKWPPQSRQCTALAACGLGQGGVGQSKSRST